MKFISPLISDARNSLGGTTYARNPSGVYARARKAPTQPRTVSQQLNRANFAAAASAWRSLTQAQIVAWNNLASATVWTDTLGNTFNPSGIQLFIRCQRNLQSIGASPTTNAPGAPPALADAGPVTLAAATVDGFLETLTVTPSSAAIATPSNCILQMTAPFSPTVSFVPPFAYRNIAPPLKTNGPAATVTLGTLTGGDAGGFDVGGGGTAMIVPLPLPAGALASFRVGTYFGNLHGSPLNIWILVPVGSSFAIVDSFTVTMNGAFVYPTYTAGTDYTPRNVPEGAYFAYGATGTTTMRALTLITGQNALYAESYPPTLGTTWTEYGATCSATVTITNAAAATAYTPEDAYVALFGHPAAGQKIGARVVLVDPATGYASPAATATAIVSGS